MTRLFAVIALGSTLLLVSPARAQLGSDWLEGLWPTVPEQDRYHVLRMGRQMMVLGHKSAKKSAPPVNQVTGNP